MTNKNTRKIYILSFIAPVLLMLLAYLSAGIFVDKSILINDLHTQYINFLSYFRASVFQNGIFYSFAKDMGDNFFGIFSYYLASPFNLLTLLASPANIEYAVSGIILLRFGLYALSFTWFLSKQGKQLGFLSIAFSTLYALSSFVMLFSYHILWADAFILLPIIIVGQQEILRGKKPWIFIISFTALLIINYYMGYMVGIFCILYFIYDYMAYGEKHTAAKNFFSMATATITSIGLAMCMLLPSFFSLLQGKLVLKEEFVAEVGYTIFNPLAIIPKLFVGGYDSVGNMSAPFIYCGGAMGLLLMGYFFLQNKTKREKLATAFVLFAFAVSLYFTPLYKIWHMFALTNAFPYRFSFIISFFIIFIGEETFASYKYIDYKKYLPACAIVLLVTAGLGVWYPVHIRNIKIAITTFVGFFTVAAMAFASKKSSRAILYLVAVVLIGDMALNAAFLTRENYTALGAVPEGSFKTDYIAAEAALSQTAKDDFYRVLFIGEADTPNNSFKMGYNNYYYSFTSLPNVESEAARRNTIHTAKQEDLARGIFGTRYSIYENVITEYPGEYFPIIYTGESSAVNVTRGEDSSVFLSDYVQELTGIDIIKEDKLNKTAFKSACKVVMENSIKNVYQKGNRIKGTLVSTEENAIAYTSITYDEAWQIRVNGQRIKPQRLLENFICFDLSKEENVIEMVYYPKGIFAGLGVTFVTILWLATAAVIKKRHR